jgi:hypothetical protein
VGSIEVDCQLENFSPVKSATYRLHFQKNAQRLVQIRGNPLPVPLLSFSISATRASAGDLRYESGAIR